MGVHVINGRTSEKAMSLNRGHEARHESDTKHQKRNIPYHHGNPIIWPPAPYLQFLIGTGANFRDSDHKIGFLEKR